MVNKDFERFITILVRGRIASNLLSLRLNNNMSVEDLASEVGVKVNTINRIETKCFMPSIDILVRIACYFGVDVSVFFEEV